MCTAGWVSNKVGVFNQEPPFFQFGVWCLTSGTVAPFQHQISARAHLSCSGCRGCFNFRARPGLPCGTPLSCITRALLKCYWILITFAYLFPLLNCGAQRAGTCSSGSFQCPAWLLSPIKKHFLSIYVPDIIISVTRLMRSLLQEGLTLYEWDTGIAKQIIAK